MDFVHPLSLHNTNIYVRYTEVFLQDRLVLPKLLKVKIKDAKLVGGGQSATLSWRRAAFGAQGQMFVTIRQLLVCMCGVSSLTRGQLSFTFAAASR